MRAINLSMAMEHDTCPEEVEDEEEEEEYLIKGGFFKEMQPVPSWKFKFPPGREGPFGDEDKDEKGSIRDSEQGNPYDDDNDDDDGGDEDDEGEDDEDEQRKRRREAMAARRVSWEAVKRIIEHPSEDEQSSAGYKSTDEGENDGVGEAEEKLSVPNPPEADVDCQDTQSASGGESESGDRAEETNDVSESRPLKVEIEQDIVALILESGPEPKPGQEQQ